MGKRGRTLEDRNADAMNGGVRTLEDPVEGCADIPRARAQQDQGCGARLRVPSVPLSAPCEDRVGL